LSSLVSGLKKVGPFWLVGPISGPLMAGMVFNWREGRRLRSAIYGAALLQYSFLLPFVVAKLGLKLV